MKIFRIIITTITALFAFTMVTYATGVYQVSLGGTGTTTFNSGLVYSTGGNVSLTSSSSPTVGYITATSTTASSTFANGINITKGCYATSGTCIGSLTVPGSDTDVIYNNSGVLGANNNFSYVPNGGITVYASIVTSAGNFFNVSGSGQGLQTSDGVYEACLSSVGTCNIGSLVGAGAFDDGVNTVQLADTNNAITASGNIIDTNLSSVLSMGVSSVNFTDSPKLVISDSDRALVGASQPTAFQVLGTGAAENNLALFDNNQTTGRTGFVVSNSGDGGWDDNFVQVLINGSAYGHNYNATGMPGKSSDNGWSVLSAQSNGAALGKGLIIGTSNNNESLVFQTNGKYAGLINGVTQNWGIGATSSPSAFLSISNAYNTAANVPLLMIASTTKGISTSTIFAVYPNGNVGIGTTSPFAPLSVNGQIVGSYMTATTTTATSTLAGGLNVAGNSGLTVLQNGNVGIGSINPGIGLSVGYNDASQNMKNLMTFNNSYSGVSSWGFAKMGYYDFALAQGTNTDSPSNISMYWQRGGNVGIGTTSPASILAISNAVTTAANTPLMTVASTTGGTATTTLFTVLPNGNVGIGKANPAYAIDVNSGYVNAPGYYLGSPGFGLASGVDMNFRSTVSNSAPIFHMAGKDNAGYQFDALNITNTWVNAASTTLRARTVFNTTGNNGVAEEALRIESDNVNPYVSIAGAVSSSTFTVNGSSTFKGYVGIGGTILPEAVLDVSSTSAGTRVAVLKLSNTSSNTGSDASIDVRTAGSDTVTTRIGNIIEADATRSMYFSTWNGSALTEKLRVAGNGNVGIGTSTPSNTLDVYGSVRFEGISYVQTASLGGGALLAGACSSVTTTSSGLSSTTAIVTTPQSDPGDGFSWNSIVMTSTSIKTRVCAAVAGTPTASLYNLKIIN